MSKWARDGGDMTSQKGVKVIGGRWGNKGIREVRGE